MREQKPALTGHRPHQWWVGVVSGMASYLDAAAIVTFGIAVVIYQAVFGLSAGQVGLAQGALTFSVAVGALVGGRLGDRFGRRPVFTLTMLVTILGSVLLVVAGSFLPVVLGAVLVGLATGADLPVSLSTIAEAADESSRGKLLGFSNVLWIIGVLAAIVGGTTLGGLGRVGAQVMFAHLGVVALLVMAARLTIPESAVWLTARAERDAGVSARVPGAGVRELLRPPYRRAFLTLIGFYALVNLAANTTGQFGTYLLVNAAHVDVAKASSLGLLVLPITVAGFVWFMRIADGPHRFRYFTVGAVFFVAAQLVPAVLGFSVPTYLVSALLGVVGTAFAFETVMKAWAQESFPTLLRTSAQGAIIAVARVVAAVFAVFTPALIAVGPRALFAVLSLVVAVGTAIAWSGFRGRGGRSEFGPTAQPESATSSRA